MHYVERLDRFTEEDVVTARRFQEMLSRDKNAIVLPEIRDWIKYVAANYSITAIDNAKEQLNSPSEN